MSNIEEMMAAATEQEVVYIHLGIPMGAFKKLNMLAMKKKKSVVTFISEAMQEKIQRMEEEDERIRRRDNESEHMAGDAGRRVHRVGRATDSSR